MASNWNTFLTGLKTYIDKKSPNAATEKPLIAGTAAVGSSEKYAREDHVHPVQTTVSGNAGTATKLKTARAITLGGDASGTANFDGNADITITVTLADTTVSAGSYGPSADASPAHKGTFVVPEVTVDSKGRVTKVTNRTITLPADNNTTYSVFTGATASAGGTTGLVPAPASGNTDLFLKSDGKWGTPKDTIYTLPTATDGALGGVKTGYQTADKNYAVKVDNNGNAYVNVPWSDTNTDTKVTENLTTSNAKFPLLLAPNGQAATTTTVSYFGTKFQANPSTGELEATTFSGALKGNADTATKLAAAKLIDGTEFDGSEAVTRYGTCDTVAGTVAKVATVNGGKGFTLVEGAIVFIKMTAANSIANPTLNVNGTGAIAIKRYGTTAPSTSAATSWNAGSVVGFAYDGTNWQMIGWLDSNTWTAFKGATSTTAGTAGYVPAPTAGDTEKFFKSDGTWGTPPDTKYTLPTAASGTLGGIKTGYTGSGNNYAVTVDGNGNAYVSVPWKDTTYSNFGGATESKAGSAGLVPAPTAGKGRFLRSDGTWAEPEDTVYSLPTADTNTLGGIKTGYSANSKNYPVAVDGSGNAYVSVPWTDTNTKVTETVTTSNANYPLLLAPSNQTATTTTTAYFDSGVTLNPSTNTIEANVSGSAGYTTFDVTSMSGKNIADLRAFLDDLLTQASSAKGIMISTTITASAWISYWNDENLTTALSAGSRWTFHVIQSYSANTYGTLLVTNYSDNNTYIIVKNNGKWGQVKRVVLEENVPVAGTATPLVASTAKVGTSTKYAREDHVHPVQTSVSGNAGTATKLAAAKDISLSGDASGSASFDGSAAVTITVTLATSGVTAGSYGPTGNTSPAHSGTFKVPQITVDAKGRVTSVTDRTITLPADNNTTYSVFGAASASAAGSNGLVPAPAKGAQDSFLKGDGTWAVPTDTKYTLPTAGTSTLGGIKTNYSASGQNYAVKVDGSGNAYVNVPWTDNDTDTKVTQTAIPANDASDYPLLLAPSGQSTTKTGGVYFYTGIQFKVSTNTFKGANIDGNAYSASRLETARNIGGISFNGSSNIHNYGTCTNTASIVSKTASVNGGSGFTLTEGAVVFIKMSYINTATDPTLNVNSTGAKPIKLYGTTGPGNTAAVSWNAGSVVGFVYDGTNWQMIGWLNTDTDTDTTYSAFGGATSSAAGSSGLVPAPAKGKQDSFLKGDGTWGNVDLSDYMLKNNPVGTGTFSLNRKSNTTIATYSVAIGYEVTASGAYSYAEGYKTTASGYASHAEGNNTNASRDYSHAEGSNTIASGWAAHAEGSSITDGSGTTNSSALSFASHAEGVGCISGNSNMSSSVTSVSGTHAEGFKTSATDMASHSEGYQTTSSGYASHAEGKDTIAARSGAHAEGTSSKLGNTSTSATEYAGPIAYMDGSHAEGIGTEAGADGVINKGFAAHAEGITTTATANASHAEGEGTAASGERSHVEGYYSKAFAAGGHAEGYNTKVYNAYGHAEGYYSSVGSEEAGAINNAHGNHAEGYYANATGIYSSHAEGFHSSATGSHGSHAEGYYATASGNYSSHAEGYYVTASGNYGSHAEGYYTTASGIYGSHAEGCKKTYSGVSYSGPIAYVDGSHAEGIGTEAGADGVATKGYASHAEGIGSKATGDAAHAEGKSTTASGESSHAEGKDTEASGTYSHSEGFGGSASGAYSHNEGYGTTASGNYNHAEGYQSKAYASYASHAEGYQTKVGTEDSSSTGYYGSHAEGYKTTASGSYGSHAEGAGTVASGTCSHAEGCGGNLYIYPVKGGSSVSCTGAVACSNGAHAEGIGTVAGDEPDVTMLTLGYAAHAEGYYSRALGAGAHAEGAKSKLGNTASSATEYPAPIAYTDGSHAEGVGTEAGAVRTGESTNTVGYAAHAEGLRTKSLGNGSHAEGYGGKIGTSATVHNGPIAYGNGAHAEGVATVAGSSANGEGYGYAAHAEGYYTQAIGHASHTEGSYTKTYSNLCHAEGYYTEAGVSGQNDGPSDAGMYAHAEGYYSKATAVYAHAEGYYATASGAQSHAEGYKTTALASQHVQGHYNDTTKAAAGSTTGTTGTAFVIGNGTSSTASNAFRITYAGAAIGKAAYESTGADYAEFREWADGNPDNEDRRGYFVTIIDGLIHKANPGDFIEGIISGHPCVIGNFDESWSGQFLKDEWGEYIYEDIEVTDPETGETYMERSYKVNPDYDPSVPYIPREERPEWDPVGMMGHLSVRDDGTCKVNGYCKVAEGGIATAADRGYRVIKRIAENIIEIVFSIYAQF